MPKFGTVSLEGASGQSYEFDVYPRANMFKPFGAVYLLCKRIPFTDRDAEYTWIYVGETGDISRRPFDVDHKSCIDRHEANSVCLHLEDDAARRAKIVDDIQRAHAPPCNDPSPV